MVKRDEVKLPKLPEPHFKTEYADAANTPAVRSGHEVGGYVKRQESYTADQMRDYARAAIAALGHGEAVGDAYWHHDGDGTSEMRVNWYGTPPASGTPLYTHAQQPVPRVSVEAAQSLERTSNLLADVQARQEARDRALERIPQPVVPEGWVNTLNHVIDQISAAIKEHRGNDPFVLVGPVELVGWHGAICKIAGEMKALAAAPTPEVQPVVPEGFVMVPERMYVPADAWEAAAFSFGGPASGDGEAYLDCTLWVGNIENDDGTKTYGLHVSCDECPEEGSITLAEFAVAQSPEAQPQGEKCCGYANPITGNCYTCGKPALECLQASLKYAAAVKAHAPQPVVPEEEDECPHCVNGITPMTMDRPCRHCTPTLHTHTQEGRG